MTQERPLRRFYHADRGRTLVEGQRLELNAHGASRFGCAYWPTITQMPIEQMNRAQRREFILEKIRQDFFAQHYPSRRQCLFAANSIQEALQFAHAFDEIPDFEVPIFEIFASYFWTFDMTWLDYDCEGDLNKQYTHSNEYWNAAISNNNPTVGERRPPRLEVMIALPAQVGRIVAHAKPNLPSPDIL